MDFRVLGPLVVVGEEGGLVDLGGPRQRRLLAALIASRNEVASTDRLIDIVFEGEPTAGASTTIRSYVARLRKALDEGGGDGLVVTEAPGYVLRLGPDDLDADRFTNALDAGREELAGGDARAAVDTLRDALAMWRGPAFDGLGFEEWLQAEVAGLDERRAVAEENLIDALLESGLASDAVTRLQELVDEYPLRDRFRAQLMLALYRTGRQAEALRSFQDYRQLLIDVALEPSEELAALDRSIVVQDPALQLAAPVGRPLRGYRLSDEIGTGSHGVVYRAVQPGVGREVAVKMIRPELADDPGFIRRFDTEAQLVSRLQHPNIVPLHDFWREPGGAYLVMRLLPGDLSDHLAGGPMGVDDVRRLAGQVGSALMAAHRAGVVHGDVKPSNVLVDHDKNAYLADFGVATLVADEGAPPPSDRSGHESPERLGGDPTSPASDQFALAVVLTQALTGLLPFGRQAISSPHDRLESVHLHRPSVPLEVDDVLSKATAWHPHDRYRDVNAFIDELTVALGGPKPSNAPEGDLRRYPLEQTSGASRWLPPDTPFVGRDDELRTLSELTNGHRLVTVVGTGGVGKSRLVMELLDRQSTPAVVVLLAAVEPDGGVDAALATELGLEPSADSFTESIVERLQMRPATVVLDNCEHVAACARDLVDELLRRVEGLSIIATSRRRLGLSQEQLLALEPLALPVEGDLDAPSVRLFVDCVSRAAPHVPLETADAAVVTDVCRLLGGLPLALELAAARVEVLGLVELRRQLVGGELPDATGARTMDEAVGWSLGLLSGEARQLFGEVCLFPASFTIEGVEVVSCLPVPIRALVELVDASLVRVEGDWAHRSYRILEPIRQVGSREVPEEALDKFLSWVAALGERAQRLWMDWNARASHELVEARHDDFRHALSVMAERADDERCGRLARDLAFPLQSEPEPELVSFILERSPHTTDGLLARAILEWEVGEPQASVEHADRVVELVDETDERRPLAWTAAVPALSFLGQIDRMVESARLIVDHPASPAKIRADGVGLWALGECYRGDIDAARRVFAENEVHLRAGQPALIHFVRAELVSATNPDEALEWLDEGAMQASGDRDLLFARMIEIARLALLVRSGSQGRASRLARNLIDELLIAGLVPQAWMSLRHVAALLAEAGEYSIAARILTSASASPRAPALVGEAAAEEAALQRRIQDELEATPKAHSGDHQPSSAGELWTEVDAALQRVERNDHAERPGAATTHFVI